MNCCGSESARFCFPDRPCTQFFNDGIRATPTERERCRAWGGRCYIHCPLTCNLGRKSGAGLNAIQNDLDALGDLPGACVVHIGSGSSIYPVIDNLNDLMVPAGRKLLLEIPAGQGKSLGVDWTQLRLIFEGLDTNRIGLCIDTQHAFASGLCNFNSTESVHRLFDCSFATIGLIHLNDSMKPFGGRVDRHAPLKTGLIWGSSSETLGTVVGRARELGLDLILETGESKDLAIVDSY